MFTSTQITTKLKPLAPFLGLKNIKILASIFGNVVEDLTNGLETDTISETTTGNGVAIDGAKIKDGVFIAKPTPVAIDVTATATAAQIASGYLTSSTAAAVSITLPTATELATALGANQGDSFEFAVENTGSSNAITMVLGSGITAATPVITGGGTLTISAANDVGVFKVVFTSATAAKLFRIG